ncbi:MAG TPA: signal peptidase I [bacterium]|nr:signal peptidase I [bacterium]
MKGGLGWLRNLGREWTPVIIAVLLIRSFVVEAFMVPTGSMLNTILIGDFMLVNKFVYGVKLPFTDKTIIPVSSPKRGDIIVFRFPVDTDDPQPPERYARLFPRWLPLLPLFWDSRAHFFTWYVPRNFIKRCIAVAGDTVEYRNKELYVNGRLQAEPYAVHTDSRTLPGFEPTPPQADFQRAWEERGFYESDYSAYVRDQFGPVVVPAGHVFAMGDNRDNSEDARFWGPLDLRYLRGKPLVIYFSSDAAPNIARVILSPWAIRFSRIGRIVR